MPTLREILDQDYNTQLGQASPELVRDAMQAYRELSNHLRKVPISGNQMLRLNQKRLINRISPIHLGRMCLYYYWPKLREKLPYYDRFPLVMPIQIYPDGFLGLNFHYLPPKHRAMLLDMIDKYVLKATWLSERKAMRITYNILKSAVRIPIYEPCIKRYLYTHLRSKIYLIEPENWNISLFLPLERFDKATTARVHQDSIRKIRKHGAIRY